MTRDRIGTAIGCVVCAVLIAVFLAACGHTQTKVETVAITLPIPVPCAQSLGPEPNYPDTDEALSAAPNIFEWVKLTKAGRLMRIARAAELQAAIAACQVKP